MVWMAEFFQGGHDVKCNVADGVVDILFRVVPILRIPVILALLCSEPKSSDELLVDFISA